MEEYLVYRDKAYRFKHHNHPLPPIVEQEAVVDFVDMDTDRSGTIDWREFLNHEAGKRLSKLKKVTGTLYSHVDGVIDSN